MKRLIIICEGPTEIEFCKDVLSSHFLSKGISIQTPLIKKSGGGIVPWQTLKRQVEGHLIQDRDAKVTTLIDYYGIHKRHEFPDWQVALRIVDKTERMLTLERGMSDDLSDNLRYRFLPYIQLHEFEGLLFNNLNTFTNQIPTEDFLNIEELIRTIDQYPNPELINDTPDNAPSYRLRRLIKGYNKIVYGATLAQQIGLARIRGKCPRFNEWIAKMEII